MTKTRDELATLVGQKLFIIEGAEALEAGDRVAIRSVIDSRMEFLRSTEGVYWDDDTIPDDLFDVLSEYFLPYVAPLFTPESMDTYWTRSAIALGDMRGLIAPMSDNTPIEATYF